MSAYETVAVPFGLKGNRRYLSDEQLADDPCLADFVRRFSHCFERDEAAAIWLMEDA